MMVHWIIKWHLTGSDPGGEGGGGGGGGGLWGLKPHPFKLKRFINLLTNLRNITFFHLPFCVNKHVGIHLYFNN